MVATVRLNFDISGLTNRGKRIFYQLLENEAYLWRSGHLPTDERTPFGGDNSIYTIDYISAEPDGRIGGGVRGTHNIDVTFLEQLPPDMVRMEFPNVF